MVKQKTCNLNALVPTKKEITFTNQYSGLIDKLQHTNFSKNQKGGGGTPLMRQAADMISNSIQKIGLEGTARMITLFMPKQIQDRIIKVGEDARKLQQQTGGSGRRRTRKRFRGGVLEEGSEEGSENHEFEGTGSSEKKSSDKTSSDKKSSDKRSSERKRSRKSSESKDAGEYTGERNDKNEMHGKGKMIYTNGDIYEGEWKNGKRNGEGTMTYQNKTSYVGRWANDQINGYGTFKYFNGDVYEGTFVNGIKSGDGNMTYENGIVYKGKWKNDLRHGRGKQTFPNGDVFEGSWIKDKREGSGKLTTKAGEVTEDTWENDETFNQSINSLYSQVGKIGSLASPIVDNIAQSQSKIFSLGAACTAFSSVLVTLTLIRDQFIGLFTTNTALQKNTNIFLQNLKTSGETLTSEQARAKLKDFLETNKGTFNVNTGIDLDSYAKTATQNWGKGFLSSMGVDFGGYGVYIAGIGLVTLGYFIYLRLFGDEEKNKLLDKAVKQKKSSSSSTKRRRK